eukprot:06859.XXX_375094_375315_1 [CDS] Oithona nana genome sequencing.
MEEVRLIILFLTYQQSNLEFWQRLVWQCVGRHWHLDLIGHHSFSCLYTLDDTLIDIVTDWGMHILDFINQLAS